MVTDEIRGNERINGDRGRSDIEGKAAREAARMEPRGREQHRWANREVEWAGAHESKCGQRASFNGVHGNGRHGREHGVLGMEPAGSGAT